MSRNRYSKATNFYEHLKLALDLYNDPERLGAESPLAAPYFLGQALSQDSDTAQGRGLVLQDVFDGTLQALWGSTTLPSKDELMTAVEKEQDASNSGPCYDFLLLDLNYANQCYLPAPTSQSQIYNDILHISRATHDRHLRAAVKRFGDILLQRLRPSLRLEHPMPPVKLIGREAIVASCLATLSNGQSVALTGAGGMGKTALGAAICDQWDSPAVFWFTVRPTFNDYLGSLLFALGHFLHQQGASALWLQLVADGGQLKDQNLALGLARADLESLSSQPLLCIDEVNFLRAADPDQELAHHSQLLEFIDGLRGHTALLLMGQSSILEVDSLHALDALSPHDMTLWLEQENIDHSHEDAERLYGYTRGNARLIELCLALHRSVETELALSDTITQLPQTPSLAPLWQRIQRRLTAQERELLWSLSVFRSDAPEDAWHEPPDGSQGDLLSSLLHRRLIRRKVQGGISLLPALRHIVYDSLPIETRERLHLEAANTRLERGEYTAAAYHNIQGGQPDRAIDLWYNHREEEIARGHSAAALALFEQVSQNGLEPRRAKELALLRSELYQFAGKPNAIIETLAQSTWPLDDEMSADAALLEGRALRTLGDSPQAIARFEQGLSTIARLHQKASRIYFHRSQTHLYQRQMDDAWREAKMALCNAEMVQGNVEEQRGNLVEAQEHYDRALHAASEAENEVWMAHAHQNLGNIAGRLQKTEQAVNHYETTMDLYKQNGDRFSLETTRSNMAFAYIQAALFEEAIPPASQALKFFQRIQDPHWIALNAHNLAEAQSELDLLVEAEENANLVFDQEEPFLHPYALFTMGRIRTKQDKLPDAYHFYEQSRQIAEMNEDRFLLAYAWRAVGEIQLQQQDKENGLAAFAESLRLFESMGIESEIETTKQGMNARL